MAKRSHWYKPRKPKPAFCLMCAKEFVRENPIQQFCSDGCYYEHQVVKHPPRTTVKCRCVECGRLFKPRRPKPYCSRDCYQRTRKIPEEVKIAKDNEDWLSRA